MDSGQLHAAEAAEARRLELGLAQKGTGVDPKTWRQFIDGEKWPETELTRSRIEAHLDWRNGALVRIAAGVSDSKAEALESDRRFETQEQAEAMLGRLMLRAEGTKRLVLALREAFDRKNQADVDRLIKELDEYLNGPESDRP